MQSPPAEAMVQHARQHLHRFESGLPQGIRAVWSDMIHARIDGREEQYLLNPLAQPLLSVQQWAIDCVKADRAISDAMVADLVGASVVGYHGIRLQDDFIDEQSGDPIVVMLLSAAALSHADGLIARHVEDHRFWDAHSEIMTAYADAMQFERVVRSSPGRYDSDSFDRVLQRSRPLAIPGLAILAVTDHWELQGRFQELVRHATKAVQIANDLRDAPTDLEAGNHTWVLTILGAGRASAAFDESLVSGFDTVVDLISGELEVTAGLARQVGADSAVSWSTSAATELEQFQTSFWTRLFRAGAARLSGDYGDWTR